MTNTILEGISCYNSYKFNAFNSRCVQVLNELCEIRIQEPNYVGRITF
jgi:hypothetical protein